MRVDIAPGKYIVAVSGGIDSVVLLDIISRQSDLDLIVAHFDHGIRKDSAEDRKFVQNLAKKYGKNFRYKTEKLGENASEELARERRYKFLKKIAKDFGAKSIITAHHKDDLLETAIFNLLRGTGRSGLSSLKSSEDILRPLLNFKKAEITAYAKKNDLVWREDPTNKSLKYSRNRIRSFLSNISDAEKNSIFKIINQSSVKNIEMDALVEGLFAHGYNAKNQSFDRSFFVSLPHKVACEVLIFWMKKLGAKYDKKLIERQVNNLKTLPVGSVVDINKDYVFVLDKKQISTRAR